MIFSISIFSSRSPLLLLFFSIGFGDANRRAKWTKGFVWVGFGRWGWREGRTKGGPGVDGVSAKGFGQRGRLSEWDLSCSVASQWVSVGFARSKNLGS